MSNICPPFWVNCVGTNRRLSVCFKISDSLLSIATYNVSVNKRSISQPSDNLTIKCKISLSKLLWISYVKGNSLSEGVIAFPILKILSNLSPSDRDGSTDSVLRLDNILAHWWEHFDISSFLNLGDHFIIRQYKYY